MGKELGEEQRMGAVESPGERRGAEAEYVRTYVFYLAGFPVCAYKLLGGKVDGGERFC